MSLLGIVIVLLVVGTLVYCVNAIPTIDPTFKKIIFAIVVLVALLWLLEAHGVFAGPAFGPVHRRLC